MRWVAFGVEPVGVIAVGANATGVIAIGQLATGVVAVGQLARGGIVAGQLAVGIVSIGQLALGVWWAAGMLGVALRSPGAAVWRIRPAIIGLPLLLLVWWFSTGYWLADAYTREGGVFVDPPPPACTDDPMRAC
jgi:hypothetical protein